MNLKVWSNTIQQLKLTKNSYIRYQKSLKHGALAKKKKKKKKKKPILEEKANAMQNYS